MNNLMKFALVAAAVVVVAVAGYNLLPARTGFGAPATPTPAVSPGPVPSGSIGPGTYRSSDPKITVAPYDVTVSGGWTPGVGIGRGDPFAGNGVTLTTWLIDHVYGDGCHWSGTLVPVANRAQLVAALVAQVGDSHSTPVDTTIGGLPATKIVMSLDPSFDMAACNNDPIVRMWPDPGPDESGGWGLTPGETATVYALEANGKVGVLMTVQHADSPPADVAALQQILDSVRFLP